MLLNFLLQTVQQLVDDEDCASYYVESEPGRHHIYAFNYIVSMGTFLKPTAMIVV